MIRKLRRKNNLKIYRCCSDYAIKHVVPSLYRELNGKTVVYKTARGYEPQKIFRFRYINYKKACNMLMFFNPKNKIKRDGFLFEYFKF